MTEEKPLDEYEVMGDGLNIDLIPAYQISSNERNIMLVATGLFILSILRRSLGVFFPHVTGFTLGQNQAFILILVISGCYSLYFFRNYFKYYGLNALVQITWVVFVSDILLDLFYLLSTVEIVIPLTVDRVINPISIVSCIFLIVKVLKLDSKNYTAIKPLKTSVKILIITVFFNILLSTGVLYFLPMEWFNYLELMYLPLAVYNMFIIKFTLVLKIKEDEHYI